MLLQTSSDPTEALKRELHDIRLDLQRYQQDRNQLQYVPCLCILNVLWFFWLVSRFFFGERSVSLYKQDMAQTSKSDEKLAPDNRQWCRYWRKREHYTRNKRGIYLMHLISFCILVSITKIRRRVKWEQPSQCALLVSSVRMTWFRQMMVVLLFYFLRPVHPKMDAFYSLDRWQKCMVHCERTFFISFKKVTLILLQIINISQLTVIQIS